MKIYSDCPNCKRITKNITIINNLALRKPRILYSCNKCNVCWED